MKMILTRILLASSLALAFPLAGCSSDDSVDSNTGKTISDLDIGGDLTLDKGKTQQMVATVKYADGTSSNVTSNSNLVWNVGDTGVATISKDGVVTGASVGATTIKATYQNKESASRALIVK